jgi:hypothetical protein
MDRTGRDVDAFLESLPVDVRADMKLLDAQISSVMAGLPRVLYEGKFWGGSDQQIVGYGIQRYQRSDKREVEWFLVGLAQQKHYLSLYVSAVEDGHYLSEKYGKDLGKVKAGKSSISFKTVADIDLEKLTRLLEKARQISEDVG